MRKAATSAILYQEKAKEANPAWTNSLRISLPSSSVRRSGTTVRI
jgi:hypothetical protein